MSRSSLMIAVAPLLVASHMSPVPSFFWSGRSFFNGQNAMALEETSSSDVESVLASMVSQSAMKDTPLKKYVRSESEAPELAVIFLHDKLRSDEVSRLGSDNSGSFDNLKGMLRSSPSSVSVPYAFHSQGDMQRSVAAVLSQASKGGKVLVASDSAQASHALLQLEAAQQLTVQELNAYLAAHPELGSNGVTDVLCVLLHSERDLLAAQDALMGHVMSTVDAVSAGNFVAALTADEAAPADVSLAFATRGRQLGVQTEGDAAADQMPVSPEIIGGFMVAFLLAYILSNALGCIMALKTPLSFEEAKAE